MKETERMENTMEIEKHELNNQKYWHRFSVNGLVKATLIFAIVPFIILSFFCHPCADDYEVVVKVNNMGYWGFNIWFYNNWSGVYSGAALVTLYGLIVGLSTYWLVPLITIAGLLTAFYKLIKSLSFGHYGRGQIFWCSFFLLILYMLYMPETSTGIYWLPAANYQYGHIIGMILIALLVQPPLESRFWRKCGYVLLCCVMAFLAIGAQTTPMVVLFCCLTVGFFMALSTRSKGCIYWGIVWCVALICVLFVVLAPGNSIRLEYVSNQDKLFVSIIKTFYCAGDYLRIWCCNPSLYLAGLLFVPVAYSLSGKIEWLQKHRKIILLLPLAWLAIIVVSFFLSFWSLGHKPPLRSVNTIFLFFLLGWFSSILVVASFCRDFTSRSFFLVDIDSSIIKLLLIFSLFCSANLRRSHKSLVTAWPYHNQIKQRHIMIQEAVARGDKDIQVERLRKIPQTIHFTDITEDPGFWRNQWYAKYWGAETISIKPRESKERQ